jgi:hypothetical protein
MSTADYGIPEMDYGIPEIEATIPSFLPSASRLLMAG